MPIWTILEAFRLKQLLKFSEKNTIAFVSTETVKKSFQTRIEKKKRFEIYFKIFYLHNAEKPNLLTPAKQANALSHTVLIKSFWFISVLLINLRQKKKKWHRFIPLAYPSYRSAVKSTHRAANRYQLEYGHTMGEKNYLFRKLIINYNYTVEELHRPSCSIAAAAAVACREGGDSFTHTMRDAQTEQYVRACSNRPYCVGMYARSPWQHCIDWDMEDNKFRRPQPCCCCCWIPTIPGVSVDVRWLYFTVE